MAMSAYALAVLIIVFFLTSVVGVVTGSNSLIAVPAMFQFGIDPRVAVATNMFALVFMSVGGTIPFLRQGKIEMTFKMKDRPLPQIWALRYDGSRSTKVEPRRTDDGFAFEAKAVTNPETFAAFEITWEPMQ